MGWTIRGSNPGRSKRVFSCSKSSRPTLRTTQPSIQWEPRFLPGDNAAHLHLAPRLRMSGDVGLLLPLQAFLAWRGATLHLPSLLPFLSLYFFLLTVKLYKIAGPRVAISYDVDDFHLKQTNSRGEKKETKTKYTLF